MPFHALNRLNSKNDNNKSLEGGGPDIWWWTGHYNWTKGNILSLNSELQSLRANLTK